MRCRICGDAAVINMRQHKLALCAEHFSPWFIKQTERTIHKYHMFGSDQRLLVAVSGGKDSLALWDVLLKLGYHADGVYIDLGIDGGFGYSAQSKAKAQQFADSRQVTLHIVDVPAQFGESIPETALRLQRKNKPCAVCGLIKRHEMNRITQELGYDVLLTGHNLDDEAATLFGNVLHWQTGYLSRQHPVLPADHEGFARKVKPFCRMAERETAAYTLINGIDYIEAECPYAAGATSIQHKEQLTQMEHDSPGTKLQFYSKFITARDKGWFDPPAEATSEPERKMNICPECGQPTTSENLCSFCRLWVKQSASRE